jgi:hypothetical protein
MEHTLVVGYSHAIRRPLEGGGDSPAPYVNGGDRLKRLASKCLNPWSVSVLRLRLACADRALRPPTLPPPR